MMEKIEGFARKGNEIHNKTEQENMQQEKIWGEKKTNFTPLI